MPLVARFLDAGVPHLAHCSLGLQQLVSAGSLAHGHRGRVLRHHGAVLWLAHAVAGGEHEGSSAIPLVQRSLDLCEAPSTTAS
jgi:hypothetical protein